MKYKQYFLDADKGMENGGTTPADKQDEKSEKDLNLENQGEEKETEGETVDDEIDWRQAAMSFKSELKRIKSQLREREATQSDEDASNRVEAIRRKAREKGFSEDVADLLAETTADILKTIPKNDPYAQEVKEEIEDLKTEIPGIEKYEKEIYEKYRKLKKADPEITVMDIIRMRVPGKKPVRNEIELEIEQKKALERRNKESKGPSGDAGSSNNPYPLTTEEKETLKKLQQARPERGWNAEKYYKLMKK